LVKQTEEVKGLSCKQVLFGFESQKSRKMTNRYPKIFKVPNLFSGSLPY